MAYLKKTLIKITTVPESLMAFSKGHGQLLNDYFNVIAVSSNDENLRSFSIRENIRTVSVNMNRRISFFKDIISVYKMYKVFRKEKPFIIHSMTPKAGLVSMLAGFLARVPHRIHTFTGLIFPTERGFKRLLLLNIDRLICHMATIVVPEGHGVKNDLLKSKVTHKHLEVIANGNFNGVDLEYFKSDLYSSNALQEIKDKHAINDNEFIFSFIGRMVPDKGVEELVRTFCKVVDEYDFSRLILVGDFYDNLDPVSHETFESVMNNKKIIHIPKQIDIRPYLAISDVFVFPSHREGFPNTVLEAGAMGLPCIVTDINGSNEIIKNGINGIIINKQNENELKDAMIYLITNRSVLKNMAGNARKLIACRFDRKYVQQELLKLYMRLK